MTSGASACSRRRVIRRTQGALKNLDHRVARSTSAAGLKDDGIPPAPGRPASWRTVLRAHWGENAGADFFTTEVWTSRGLVTYYTVCAGPEESARARGGLDAESRYCVHDVGGAAPQRRRRWYLSGHRVLIGDRDGKWTEGVRRIMEGAGVSVVLTPVQAPERQRRCGAVRTVDPRGVSGPPDSVRGEAARLLRARDEFVEHYYKERNHQGLGNDLIVPARRSGRGPAFDARGGAPPQAFTVVPIRSRFTSMPAAARSQVSAVTPSERMRCFCTFWVGVFGSSATTRM